MVYYLQEMLRISGILAQSILVVLMIMSIYAFFKVNTYYRTGLYLKCLNVMLLVITVYGLILFFSGFALYPDEFNMNTTLKFGYIQRYYISVFPIYAFYLYSLKGDISEKNMKYIFMAFLLFSIIMYYQNFMHVSTEIEKEEITNNMGYTFVPLIPMLALFKMNDIWKYITLIIIFVFITMAMKRGAVLVGAVAALLYMMHNLKTNSTKQVFYIMLLSFVAICFIYLYVTNLYETSSYFRTRIENTLEGDSSNRGWLYSHYFDYFIHLTSSTEFLFGCGANATYLRLGRFAHNDWLEFAINQGVLGVLLYLTYWITFVWEWKNCSQNAKVYKQVLGDLIVIYFLKSCFSMSFDGMATATTLCIGFCLANNVKCMSKMLLQTKKKEVRI